MTKTVRWGEIIYGTKYVSKTNHNSEIQISHYYKVDCRYKDGYESCFFCEIEIDHGLPHIARLKEIVTTKASRVSYLSFQSSSKA